MADNQSHDLQSGVLGKSIQLFKRTFINNNFQIDLVPESLNELKQNFKSNKPVAILVALGNIGMGKSTWLNMIIYQASNKIQKENAFETSSSMLSVTEGIWAFSQPVFWSGKQDVQILLIDMEGQSGILQGNQDATKSMLQRLYLIGMMLGSSLAIHTAPRPTDEEVSRLQFSAEVFQQIERAKGGVCMPSITLFLSKKSKVDETNKAQFKEILLASKKLDENIIKMIEIYPQHTLPSDFAEESDYSYLQDSTEASKYLAQQDDYIKKQVLPHPKINFLSNRVMDICEIVAQMEKASKLINDDNFQQNFCPDYSILVLEKTNEIKKQLLVNLDSSLSQKAQSTSTEINNLNQFMKDAYSTRDNILILYKEKITESFQPLILEKAKYIIEEQATLFSQESQMLLTTEINAFEKKVLAHESEKKIQETQTNFNKQLEEQRKQNQAESERQQTTFNKQLEEQRKQIIEQSDRKIEEQRKQNQAESERQLTMFNKQLEEQRKQTLAQSDRQREEQRKQNQADSERQLTVFNKQLEEQRKQTLSQSDRYLEEQRKQNQVDSERQLTMFNKQLEEQRKQCEEQKKQNQVDSERQLTMFNKQLEEQRKQNLAYSDRQLEEQRKFNLEQQDRLIQQMKINEQKQRETEIILKEKYDQKLKEELLKEKSHDWQQMEHNFETERQQYKNQEYINQKLINQEYDQKRNKKISQFQEQMYYIQLPKKKCLISGCQYSEQYCSNPTGRCIERCSKCWEVYGNHSEYCRNKIGGCQIF